MADADRERATSIARYLIERLRRCYSADLSDSAFSKLLYPEIESASTRNSRVQSLLNGNSDLTTTRLVDLMTRINRHSEQTPHNQLLTPEEILTLFQRLIQLTPEEKQQLGLLTGAEEILLQQALLNMRLYYDRQNYETFLNLYSTSMSLTAYSQSGIEDSLEELYRRIPDILASRLHYLPESTSPNFVQEVTGIVKREINKILLKSGAQPNHFWNSRDYATYAKRYLTAGFVERLTQAVAENKLLMRDFPIYIKKITVEDLGTLPLPVAPTSRSGLFNQDLLDLDRTQDAQANLADLAAQSAIRVTIHFSLQKEGTPIDFALSSSGIGGTLSQVVKLINTALLSDIACLQDQENGRNFFPIAHDVVVSQSIIQNNTPSPVWAHSLVMLCQCDVLAKAMTVSSHRQQMCFYDEMTFGDSIGRGDFCDFDFLQTVAKAALNARLRAIKHTGVAPAIYLRDLRDRILRTRLVQEARAYVSSYPFSSFAQEGWLRGLLLEYWDKEIPRSAPQAVFNAYLLIAETFLQEGMYRRAYGYLRRLKPVLGRLAEQSETWYESFNSGQTAAARPIAFENFSGSLLVRYQLCWATYYYLLDRKSDRVDPRYRKYFDDLPRDADEQSVIRKAWETVNKAERLLSVRLAKYLIIGEISQGTFHPHYQLLAQIYFLRTRMLLFFPQQVPIDRQGQYLPTDVRVMAGRRDINAIYGGWLHLLEKARLYAACGGNQELYACYTAYQSCIYVMASYLDGGLTLAHNDRESVLSAQDCMRWAAQLRNHALLSYANTGRHCYYQIKEKSGISKSLNRSYGRYAIEEIPPIREMLNQDEERPGQHDNGILYIDMELLGIRREFCQTIGENIGEDSGDPKEQVYLFGSNACYALFARGLYHLCSDDRIEFGMSQPLTTAQDWDNKLSRAYNLFTYASALAEDGGTLEQAADENSPIRMRRNFTVQEQSQIGAEQRGTEQGDTEEYCSAEAQSVRDLYPYRVTEIVDLAKIFMSVSALLRMYVGLESHDRLREEIIGALSNLHGEQSCQASNQMSALLQEQTRYNGHLETFLNQCKRILQREASRATPLTATSIAQVAEHRRRIIKSIFDRFRQEGS